MGSDGHDLQIAACITWILVMALLSIAPRGVLNFLSGGRTIFTRREILVARILGAGGALIAVGMLERLLNWGK